MKKEYKAERAVLPTRFTLLNLQLAYIAFNNRWQFDALGYLITARKRADDPQEYAEIDSVYQLAGNPEEAMARIADILTCGGKIYDKYSEFLKGE